MSSAEAALAGDHTTYWHERVRAETRAALACDDAHIAALHVEMATHCLRMAAATASDGGDQSLYVGSDQPRAIANPRSAKPESAAAIATDGPPKPSSEKATNSPEESAAAVT